MSFVDGFGTHTQRTQQKTDGQKIKDIVVIIVFVSESPRTHFAVHGLRQARFEAQVE